MNFKLVKQFEPAGDQPEAIDKLIAGVENKKNIQVLMGATGTGKTYTIANVISKINKPTLILAHNKTLAMQLYSELKTMFPENRVEYFVSNFDFFQPEAYLPSKDLYINKDAKQNLELDMMRSAATNALLTRKDVIVVSSVASIYPLQDPLEYEKNFFEIELNQKFSRKKLLTFLVQAGYRRNDIENSPGTFSAKGDVIKIIPSDISNKYIRLDLFDDTVEEIVIFNLIKNTVTNRLTRVTIFPANNYITSKERLKISIQRIKNELSSRLEELKKENKLIEYHRLEERTNYDIETLEEFGICSGIENYSAHLDLRKKGQIPYTLLDYFGDDYLTVIDESHISLPQIRGMSNTDKSRKVNLVNFGFRLPSAQDNRPLTFEEFIQKTKQLICTSATPGDYELEQLSKNKDMVIPQIIRPTGLIDPTIEVLPKLNQIDRIIIEINKRSLKNQRTLITTLTKRMSEDLTSFLQEKNIKVAYLHSDLKTLERSIIINDLRRGVYDTIVGVNLLREGIDIPETSLVCILDADKQGFLRNTRSLVQTIGRAARNSEGHVILFADNITDSMKEAMKETENRRNFQIAYNKKNNIIPKTIIKSVIDYSNTQANLYKNKLKNKKNKEYKLAHEQLLDELNQKMLEASQNLDFEKAAELRDIIIELKNE
ncbi:excinuclease ABC subunit UvrB [Spiroplasma endosymbiont of Amphibalanus improvisus]|uniref:excinuclease ABC subunit UvrB n=1 Tax=Spiroplasma endosymbiont of Amphibalanus improvisus TaxID=3066327 RepID=UPI00313B7491